MGSDRAEWIRLGNQAFNEGDYQKARAFFTKAEYASGLIRIGDYYMFDRRLPLLAYGYYKKAGAKEKVKDLHRRMIGALGEWIGREKIKPESLEELHLSRSKETPASFPSVTDDNGMVLISVSPILKNAAIKILEQSRSR